MTLDQAFLMLLFLHLFFKVLHPLDEDCQASEASKGTEAGLGLINNCGKSE